MKAIFIDSTNKTVSEIEVSNDRTLHHWYEILKCDLVQTACYINDKGDTILVDEEGLLKELNHKSPFFTFEGGGQPFAGSGLVVGTDDEGETIAPTVTVDYIRSKVKFLTMGEINLVF